MKHLQQPSKSLVCGQYCLAMILNLTPEESIEAIGHNKGTHGIDLINVIKKLKQCSDLLPFKNRKYLSPVSILNIRWKRGGHWVVYHKGTIYDPGESFLYEFENCFHKEIGGRITSYINVW